MDEPKMHKLCCYLFKERYKNISDVLMSKKMFDEEKYTPIDTIEQSMKTYISGYIKRDNKNKPAWLNKIRELFNVEDLFNISNSLIFFVKSEDRIFAFTNGYSNSVIDHSKIEWDFGLRVALNILSGNEIRGVDTRKISLSTHQRREISSTGSNIYEYDFDFNEEFLDSITGKSTEEDYGSSITGKESLHINVKMDLSDIKNYCKNLFVVYKKKDYTEKFPFYDKLKVNKEDAVYTKFLNDFKESLKKQENEKIQFLYPNIDDFTFFNYRFIYEKKYKDYEDISIENLNNFIEDKNISIDEIELKNFKIKISDEERNKTYSLADYIVFEFEDNGHKYIHTKNIILEIENDFYESIKNEIDECEIYNIGNLELPPIYTKITEDSKGKKKKVIEAEGAYNKRIESFSSDVISLDKDNFRDFPGRTQDQIEICDILTKNKDFVCNKIYKHSSAPLSHLFMQGYVSADMLYEVKEYREKINESVKEKFGDNFIETEKIDRSKITFIYGIGIEKDGKISETLPFFSKISLRQNIRALKKLAYNIKILRIPFVENNDLEV